MKEAHRECELDPAPRRGLHAEVVEKSRPVVAKPHQSEQRGSNEQARSAPQEQAYEMSPLDREQRVRPHEWHRGRLAE